MGSLVSIVYTPLAQAGRPQSHYLREPLDRAMLVSDRGIEGDAKARPGIRQLNVMCAEILAALRAEGFQTAPGQLGEQIVMEGIPPDSLAPGIRIQMGEAILEVTIPRTGCDRFEMIQGRPRTTVAGRLGVLAKVIEGGSIAIGDPVQRIEGS